jgi:hypothetical protein
MRRSFRDSQEANGFANKHGSLCCVLATGMRLTGVGLWRKLTDTTKG